jgi:hypothetical protein
MPIALATWRNFHPTQNLAHAIAAHAARKPKQWQEPNPRSPFGQLKPFLYFSVCLNKKV